MTYPFDNKLHELKLGNSFKKDSNTAFHSIRYDFKPASVDTSQEAHVEVNKGQVTVTVPHVEESSTTHTVFKGNAQPSLKECVLIIDHDTGAYTLEKLSTKITLKKSRLDGSSKSQEWFQQHGGRKTPSLDKKKKKKPAPKVKVEKKSSPDIRSVNPLHSGHLVKEEPGEMTMSSDSSSDSDDSLPPAAPPARPDPPRDPSLAPPAPSLPPPRPSSQSGSSSLSQQRNAFGVLNNDLALSESDDSSDDSD